MAQAIIGPQFCSPYPVDLGIVGKLLSGGEFTVKDTNGNTVFKVRDTFWTLRDRRLLVDAAGYPVITLQRKLLSAHQRWEIFRGDSTNSSNLVFSVEKSSVFQCKKNLHVFLAHNRGEYAPDFKVKGSWFKQSCVVYAGKSKSCNIVAKMHKKHGVTSVVFGKKNFKVTVFPGVDQAFIVALIIILDAMNSGSSDSSGGND